MKITLRKAGKVRNKVQQKLQTLSMQLNQLGVSVNVYADLEASRMKLNKANAEFTETLASYTALSDVVVQIRSAIATANENAGVNLLLANQAALTGKKSIFSRIARETAVAPSLEEMTSLITGQVNLNSGNGRYPEKELGFNILTQEQIDAAEAEVVTLNKALDAIVDELEERNVSVSLTLDDALVSVLTAHNIV